MIDLNDVISERAYLLFVESILLFGSAYQDLEANFWNEGLVLFITMAANILLQPLMTL